MASKEPIESSAPSAGHPPIVLMVDDDPITLRILVDSLVGESYHCLTVRDGLSVLPVAEAHPPDLVLLDVMLPGIDGIEVCRRLRAHPLHAEVPILIITSLDDRSVRQAAVAAGADDFLTKPIDRIEVRTRVRSIVRLGRYARLREEAAAAREAAEKLQGSLERLERVSRSILRAEEQERRRIAADLHDDLGQVLVALKMGLDKACTATELGTAHVALRESAALAGRAINQMRGMARSLRPSLLDDLGLPTALEILARESAQAGGIGLELEVDPGLVSTDAELDIACYRIAQQAITNVLRHAQASRLRVVLRRQGGQRVLEVEDDGIGLDASATGREPRGGLGLEVMTERAELAGGRLEIVSTPRCGTRVVARFPT